MTSIGSGQSGGPASDDDDLLSQVRRYFGVESARAARNPRPPAGTRAERYEVRGEVGRGGMGVVLRVFDRELRREVAMKVVKVPAAAPSGEAARLLERFLLEAHVTGLMEHPNIVPVHDLGTDASGNLFFTMKLVQGRTLHRLIEALDAGAAGERQAWPLERQLQVVLKVCDALAFAHARGVVHRDLKPHNIMVGDFGEVLVMDWGLAKLLPGAGGGAGSELPRGAGPASDHSPNTTMAGDVLGSPSFMSPEQARGDLDALDARTDVFGLGAALHRLLYGVPLYGDGDRSEILARATAGERTGLRAPRRLVPRELRAVVDKAVAVLPEDRYASVGALAADLRAFLSARPGQAWRDPPGARLTKAIRRHPAAATGVAGGLLLLLAGLLAAGQYRSARVESERRAAIEHADANRRFLGRLFELRSAGTVGGAYEDAADFAALHSYLAAFREQGLALDGDEPVAEASRRLAAHAGAGSVLDALYDLAQQMARCGVLHAAHGGKGPAPDWIRDATGRRWRDLAQDQPRLIAFWPRLCAIVTDLEQDPWRRRMWEAWQQMWVDGGERFELLLRQESALGRSARELTWLGEIVRFLHSPADSIPWFDRALALEPGLFWAQFWRGLAAGEAGDADAALVHLHGAVALRPDSMPARMNLAAALDRKGRRQAAIAELRAAIALDPGYYGAHNNLGRCLVDDGDLAGASECFRRAIELHPGHPVLHFNLATVLRTRGDVAGAADALRAALRLDPTRATWHYDLGLLLVRQGDLQAASASYRRAIELQPDHAEAHCNFGGVLRRLGDYAQSLRHYRTGHETGSARADWKYDSARWLAEAERLAAAEPLLAQIVAGAAQPADAREAGEAVLLAYRRQAYERAAELHASRQPAAQSSWVERRAAIASAILAGCGRGSFGSGSGGPARPELRGMALAWLQAELAAGGDLQVLAEFPTSPEFACVRDAEGLARLPAEEAAAWRSFWAALALLHLR